MGTALVSAPPCSRPRNADREEVVCDDAEHPQPMPPVHHGRQRIGNEWAVPHADADDYFWQPTSPPYRDQRAPSERISLMREIFLPRRAWVLYGLG